MGLRVGPGMLKLGEMFECRIEKREWLCLTDMSFLPVILIMTTYSYQYCIPVLPKLGLLARLTSKAAQHQIISSTSGHGSSPNSAQLLAACNVKYI